MSALTKCNIIFQQIEDRICHVQSSIGSGTGFFISETGLLVTAYHVIKCCSRHFQIEDIQVVYKQKIYSVRFSEKFLLNKTIDLCLLQICQTIQTPYFSIERRNVSDLQLGEKVYFGGFSLGQQAPHFHKSVVASRLFEQEGVAYFNIDGTILRGVSGAPVVKESENKIALIGCIFRSCADIDSRYHSNRGILEKLKKTQGIYDITIHNEEGIEAVSLLSLLVHRFSILESNMSTGLGTIIHMQHIMQIMDGNGAETCSTSKQNETPQLQMLNEFPVCFSRLTTPVIEDIGEQFHNMKDIEEGIENLQLNKTQSTVLSTQQETDRTQMCAFIIKNAKNQEAQAQAKKNLLEEIKHLDLTGKRLDKLPDLRLLPNLVYLDLTTNNLKEFPPIEGLDDLKVLNLRGNKIERLPTSLSEVKSLNEIDILANPLKEVPVGWRKWVREIPRTAKWV